MTWTTKAPERDGVYWRRKSPNAAPSDWELVRYGAEEYYSESPGFSIFGTDVRFGRDEIGGEFWDAPISPPSDAAPMREGEKVTGTPLSLAAAVIAYDDAIRQCANDPERMASFCSVHGDDLDSLYETMIERARQLV